MHCETTEESQLNPLFDYAKFKSYIPELKPFYVGPLQNESDIFLHNFLMVAATFGCSINILQNKYLEGARPGEKILQIPQNPSALRMAFTYALYSSKIIKPFNYQQEYSSMSSEAVNMSLSQLQSARSSAQLRPFMSEFDVCALTYSRMERIGLESLQIVSVFGLLSKYSTQNQLKNGIVFGQNQLERAKNIRDIRQFFLNSVMYFGQNRKSGNECYICKKFAVHHLHSQQMCRVEKEIASNSSAACLITQQDSNLFSLGENNIGVYNILSYILLCNAFGYYPCRQDVESGRFIRFDAGEWERAFIVEIKEQIDELQNEDEVILRTWQKVPEYYDEQNDKYPQVKTFQELEGGWDVQYAYGLPNGTAWTPSFRQSQKLEMKRQNSLIVNSLNEKSNANSQVIGALSFAEPMKLSADYVHQLDFIRKYVQYSKPKAVQHQIKYIIGDKPFCKAEERIWTIAWKYADYAMRGLNSIKGLLNASK